jgi:hypothetical protein
VTKKKTAPTGKGKRKRQVLAACRADLTVIARAFYAFLNVAVYHGDLARGRRIVRFIREAEVGDRIEVVEKDEVME